MSDEEGSLDEKRVYAGGREATVVFVAADVGLARVSVADDLVGEFSLVHRGPVRDAVVVDGRLALATEEDVVLERGRESPSETQSEAQSEASPTDDAVAFVETGFGPATAVGTSGGTVSDSGGDGGRLVAAGAGDGRIAVYDPDDGWGDRGTVEDVRAIDGELVAAAGGVHRLDGTHVGLDDARDVSSVGTPLAATGSGLYYLANGWMDALDGSFGVVASDGRRAHAATDEALYERVDGGRRSGGGEWEPVELPIEGVVADVALGADGTTYVLTESGALLVDAGDGWRHRSLGMAGARAIAVQ